MDCTINVRLGVTYADKLFSLPDIIIKVQPQRWNQVSTERTDSTTLCDKAGDSSVVGSSKHLSLKSSPGQDNHVQAYKRTYSTFVSHYNQL